MRDLFPGYYQPSDSEFAELWQKATFVFDTNMLLNLYRFPTTAREDLLSRMEAFRDRIWLPHHVALEFQRNRLTIIAEQKKRFHEVRKILDDNLVTLSNQIAQLQLKKRHSSIDIDGLLSEINESVERFTNRLKKLEIEQPDVNDPDPIRERIDNIFTGKVGPAPTQEFLEDLYKRGVHRYRVEQPPGYRDEKKTKGDEGEFHAGGCIYKSRFGDLILWMQLLDHAKKSAIKELVFISDDEKEDWWWQVNSMGKKTLGPRPELIQEIKQVADVNLFYMYNSQQFLRRASEFLGLPVPNHSIEQVRDVKQTSSQISLEAKYQYDIAERAVMEWLQGNYGHVQFDDSCFPEFGDEDGAIGYSIWYIKANPMLSRGDFESKFWESQEVEWPIEELIYIVVLEDEADVDEFFSGLTDPRIEFPTHISFKIGVIDKVNKGHEQFRLIKEFPL